MPKPPIDNVVKTAIVGLQHGQECVNVLHWKTPDRPSIESVQALCDAVRDAWIAHVLPVQSADFIFQRVEGLALQGPGSPNGQADVTPPTSGGDLVAADDNQQACSIKLGTGLAGKSFRGRIYVAGVPGSVVQNGFLINSFRTAVATGVQQLLNAVLAATNAFAVVVSYEANKQPRDVPIATQILTASSVTAVPASANRRRP